MNPLLIPGMKDRFAAVTETSNGRRWSIQATHSAAFRIYEHRLLWPEYNGSLVAVGGILVERIEGTTKIQGHTGWGVPFHLDSPPLWAPLEANWTYAFCPACSTRFTPPRLWNHAAGICADCTYELEDPPRPCRYLQRRFGPPIQTKRGSMKPGPALGLDR